MRIQDLFEGYIGLFTEQTDEDIKSTLIAYLTALKQSGSTEIPTEDLINEISARYKIDMDYTTLSDILQDTGLIDNVTDQTVTLASDDTTAAGTSSEDTVSQLAQQAIKSKK